MNNPNLDNNVQKMTYVPPTIEDLGNYTSLTLTNNRRFIQDSNCLPPAAGTDAFVFTPPSVCLRSGRTPI